MRTASLNNIFSILQYFGENHSQINTVIFGADWDVNNEKDQDGVLFKYFVDPTNSMGTSEVYYGFVIDVMDQVLPDEVNRQDVLSDTERICRDLVAFVRYYEGRGLNGQYSDFVLQKESISMYPFWNNMESNYWGHRLQFQLKIPFQYDECAIPGIGELPESFKLTFDDTNCILWE